MAAPLLDAATTSAVGGTACAGCAIQVFLSDNDPSGAGEGPTPLGTGTANASGTFVIPVTGLNEGDLVTAIDGGSLEGHGAGTVRADTEQEIVGPLGVHGRGCSQQQQTHQCG